MNTLAIWAFAALVFLVVFAVILPRMIRAIKQGTTATTTGSIKPGKAVGSAALAALAGVWWASAMMVSVVIAVLMFAIVWGVIDLLFIPDPPAVAAPTTPPAPPPLTPNEQDALKNDLLTIPLMDWGWRVSPQEVNLEFDRSNTESQYVMNLGHMAVLKNRITVGNADENLMRFRGTSDEWHVVLERGTSRIGAGEHALYIRSNERYPALDGNKVVGLFFQVLPPDDGSVVIQTETLIGRDEALPWGPVRTEWLSRPLNWELSVVFLDADKNLIEPSRLAEYPILVGWVNDAGEPLTAQNCVLASTQVVVFTNESPLVDDAMILKIYVPADFPTNVFTQVNMKVL